jgi:hypothetical protein
MDDSPNPGLAALRRRARRLGLCFVGLGTFAALIFWSWFGVFLGVVIASGGIYMAYGYLPLAARIRQIEERRHSAT